MANVFVGNLSYFCSHESLYELFQAYGPVTNTMIKRNSEGETRYFGFVEMERKEDIAKVVAALDQTPFMGRIMRCCFISFFYILQFQFSIQICEYDAS